MDRDTGGWGPLLNNGSWGTFSNWGPWGVGDDKNLMVSQGKEGSPVESKVAQNGVPEARRAGERAQGPCGH